MVLKVVQGPAHDKPRAEISLAMPPCHASSFNKPPAKALASQQLSQVSQSLNGGSFLEREFINIHIKV